MKDIKPEEGESAPLKSKLKKMIKGSVPVSQMRDSTRPDSSVQVIDVDKATKKSRNIKKKPKVKKPKVNKFFDVEANEGEESEEVTQLKANGKLEICKVTENL